MNANLQRILDHTNIDDIESINTYISELSVSQNTKRMYTYLITKHLESLGKDTSKLTKYEQVFKTVKNDLTFDEVESIQKIISTNEERFIFNALLETGARVQEFVCVDWQTLNDTTIHIRTIKNKNKYRSIYIEQSTFEILKSLQIDNYNFAKLTIKHIQYVLSKLGKRANLSISLSPHVLRRTKGSLLRMHRTPLEEISDILGHENIDTTRKYYSKLNTQYLKSVSSLSTIKPCDSIEIQKLLAENKLLKQQIIFLNQEIEKLKSEKRNNN